MAATAASQFMSWSPLKVMSWFCLRFGPGPGPWPGLASWPLSPFCCASVSKLSTQIDDVNNDDTKIDLLHDWQTSFWRPSETHRSKRKIASEPKAAGIVANTQNAGENENGNENGNWVKGMGVGVGNGHEGEDWNYRSHISYFDQNGFNVFTFALLALMDAQPI